MADSLVYVVPSRAAPSLMAPGGAPSELIVPRERMTVSESNLDRATLYVIAAVGEARVLSMVAVVDSVSAVEEGLLSGSFLLELVAHSSLKTTTDENRDAWRIEGCSTSIGAIESATADFVDAAEMRLRANWRTRTAPIRQLEPTNAWSPMDGQTPIITALSKLLRSKPLDELQRHVTHMNLSPVGSELMRMFETASTADAEQLFRTVQSLDPLVGIVSASSQRGTETTAAARRDRQVDCTLTRLDPDTALARRFLVGGSWSSSMSATDRAEATHQRAVRRLARAFQEIGVSPFASRSVDMACELAGGWCLIEVKSIGAHNAVEQALAAIGQLMLYASELENEKAQVARLAMVLATEAEAVLPDLIHRVADRAGIMVECVWCPPSDESPLLATARKLTDSDRARGNNS